MEKKVVVCMVSVLVFMFSSTVQAQDTCQKLHDRYRVCVESQDAGMNMDYSACAGYSDSTSCENAGCYWRADKSVCIINMCLMDGDFSGGIKGSDLNIYKKEYGRDDCPTTPSCPEPIWKLLKAGTAQCVTWVDHAPNPRFAVYDTNGLDDAVLDKDTGLIWTRAANYSVGHTSWLAAMNAGTYYSIAGTRGWRLPTIEEISSLVEISGSDPALPNGHPFILSGGEAFWSRTTYEGDSAQAWCLQFAEATGLVYPCSKNLSDHSVWPVYGGNGYATGSW